MNEWAFHIRNSKCWNCRRWNLNSMAMQIWWLNKLIETIISEMIQIGIPVTLLSLGIWKIYQYICKWHLFRYTSSLRISNLWRWERFAGRARNMFELSDDMLLRGGWPTSISISQNRAYIMESRCFWRTAKVHQVSDPEISTRLPCRQMNCTTDLSGFIPSNKCLG